MKTFIYDIMAVIVIAIIITVIGVGGNSYHDNYIMALLTMVLYKVTLLEQKE